MYIDPMRIRCIKCVLGWTQGI